MSTPAHMLAAPRTTGLGPRLRRALGVLLVLLLAVYALFAIEAGITYYRAWDKPDIAARRIALVEAGESGRAIETPAQVAAHSTVVVGLIGLVSSPLYAYGEHSLMEHIRNVYSSMPRSNIVTLMLHTALGGIGLMFGALQFWPAFRKRYPKWHRGFGATYLVVIQLSMIAAMVYLYRTGAAKTISQLFFHFGLWFLAISITLSGWMSVLSLTKKQYAQHQGWMGINFGLLLSTPMQRFGWLTFGVLTPNLHWQEADFVVTGLLVPVSVMLGYTLFVINRRVQVIRPQEALARVRQGFASVAAVGRGVAWGLMPVLVWAGVATVQHYVLNVGMSSAAGAETLIPAPVRAMQSGAVAGSAALRIVFVAATLLGLGAGGHLVWRAFIRQDETPTSWRSSAWVLAGSAMAVGLVLVQWGVQMGMPSFEHLSGGAFEIYGGCLTLVLASLLALALRRGEVAWVKEWSLFVLACVLATPAFYALLPALGALGFDAKYLQSGHIYRLAQVMQWLLILGPFVYAAYGQATQERIAR